MYAIRSYYGIVHEALFMELPRITSYNVCYTTLLRNLKTSLFSVRNLGLLVNAAGFGRFEPHEELSMKTIQEMISLNLTAPITLSNLLLRPLKENKGSIINITSIEATRSSKFSALYSATKSGLRAFGQSLFEEVRNHGVSVVTSYNFV